MPIANIIAMKKISNFNISTDSCVKLFNFFTIYVLLKPHYFYVKFAYPFGFHAIAQTLNGFNSKRKFDRIAAIAAAKH